MTFQVKAEVLLNTANWEKNLKKTSKQMEGFGKSMKTVANGVKAAWIGVSAGVIGNVYDGLVDMTKAAASDARSMALLNKQMDNSWKATAKTKQEINNYIDSISNMTGILDDNLRPAFAKIVRSVKNPTKAIKAFNMVMDISAGTGKDVNTVSAAYSKYLSGNTSALNKLVPGLKDAANGAEFLKSQFSGMAATAGQNDPFARINAVLDNFKEKVGTALLPLANDFADWLAGPDAQKAMDDVAQWASNAFGYLTSPEGKAAMKDWYDKLLKLVKTVKDIVDKLFAVQDYIDKTPAAQGALPVINKLVPNEKQRNKVWEQAGFGAVPTWLAKNLGGAGVGATLTNMPLLKGELRNVTINVTATSANGNDVVKALKSTAAARGIPLGQLLK